MDLRPVVKNHDGLLVVGDIHANVGALTRAVEFAHQNNLFLVMIGDLVDGMEFPMETILLAHEVMENNNAALVIGNHEDKFYRYFIGNPVKLSNKQKETISCAGCENEFTDIYMKVILHPLTDTYHVYGDILMIHGAAHKEIWDFPTVLKSHTKAFALYGSVTGDIDENGLPIRTYEWIDDIPSDKSVVVGHARDALGKSPYEVAMRSNPSGGIAYFIDTSCGKEKTAFLSALVVDFFPECDIIGTIEF